jgi:hypothetical protein
LGKIGSGGAVGGRAGDWPFRQLSFVIDGLRAALTWTDGARSLIWSANGRLPDMHSTPMSPSFRPAAMSGWFYGFGFWYPTGISGQESGDAA